MVEIKNTQKIHKLAFPTGPYDALELRLVPCKSLQTLTVIALSRR